MRKNAGMIRGRAIAVGEPRNLAPVSRSSYITDRKFVVATVLTSKQLDVRTLNGKTARSFFGSRLTKMFPPDTFLHNRVFL